jgi:hypothetical protein
VKAGLLEILIGERRRQIHGHIPTIEDGPYTLVSWWSTQDLDLPDVVQFKMTIPDGKTYSVDIFLSPTLPDSIGGIFMFSAIRKKTHHPGPT